jgi:hypothetical protein
MTFGRTDGDLVLSRDSVQAMIEFDDLVRDPTLWARVERGFQQLRHSYRVTYLGHHSAYHSESAEILSGLERLRPQVEALQQFNRVPEFGGPVEDDLPWRFDNLARKLKSCTASDDDLPLDDAPMCHRCELSLQEQAPRQEAALVQRDVERAMRTYNRRLSSEGARRILASPTQEQLDVFVKLVQVSDLSALANILDDQVVEFLRTFVSGGDRAEV